MPRVARLGDTHKGVCDHGFPCCPHNVSGPITGSSPNVKANGILVARLNDGVVHSCPHCGTGYISSASSKIKANSIGIARIGDSVTYPGGGGSIVASSPNVGAGG